eukprot:scaffold14268_cov90-Isochrysis_galbana.AAC.1
MFFTPSPAANQTVLAKRRRQAQPQHTGAPHRPARLSESALAFAMPAARCPAFSAGRRPPA